MRADEHETTMDSGLVVEFQLEGSAEDGGAVRLDALVVFLENLRVTVTEVGQDLSGERGEALSSRIVKLSYGSPVSVAIQPVERQSGPPIARRVVSSIKRGVQAVARGERPQGYSARSLEALAALSEPYKKRVRAVRLVGDQPEPDTAIDADMPAKVQAMLGGQISSFGSWRGRLDEVNIHGKRVIYIYPVAGPSRIRCHLTREGAANLGEMLGKHVEVTGRVWFHVDDPFPSRITGGDVHLLPTPDQLPRAAEIVGSMPDVARGMSVTDYLDMIRDE